MSSVGLYVMTQKGLAVLTAAIESGVDIAHVTTFHAAGMADDSHDAIARIAKAHHVPAFLRAHPPEYAGDYSIAAGWRWMLDTPNLVVLHDSLLPRYRGFAPLVTALVNGDPQVGVTAFLAVDGEGYDTGPIVGQLAIPVVYPSRMMDVLSRVVPLYARLAADVCETVRAGQPLRYTAQDHSLATYSLWRDDHDFRIDWANDDRSIVRLVGAASHPFPGAWTTYPDVIYMSDGPGNDRNVSRRVRVMDAVVEQDARFEQRQPGKVAWIRDGDPVVVCGAGMVRLLGVTVPLRTRFA